MNSELPEEVLVVLLYIAIPILEVASPPTEVKLVLKAFTSILHPVTSADELAVDIERPRATVGARFRRSSALIADRSLVKFIPTLLNVIGVFELTPLTRIPAAAAQPEVAVAITVLFEARNDTFRMEGGVERIQVTARAYTGARQDENAVTLLSRTDNCTTLTFNNGTELPLTLSGVSGEDSSTEPAATGHEIGVATPAVKSCSMVSLPQTSAP